MLPRQQSSPVEISLKQYIDNPYRGSAFLAARYAIRAGLNQSFTTLLSKYRTHFYAVPYLYDNGDILMHVRVPSGEYNINKIHYDVMFLIKNDDSKQIQNRNIQMFSNSPSFMFTYAYVYYNSNLMIDWLAPKLPLAALIQKPVVRNPVESLGYERTTYMAGRYILDGRVLSDAYIKKHGRKMNPAVQLYLNSTTADADKILQLYKLGQQLKVKNPRTPVNPTVRAGQLAQQRNFVKNARATAPRTAGVIRARKPQAKITAKKVIKATKAKPKR